MAATGANDVLAGKRVLVVEDEFLIAMHLESVLERQGCRIIGPAPSVEAALHLIGEETPDAALLDGNLRGRLSAPVAAALRERAVPFVVVSGYGPEQLDEEELARAPWLRKPVNERVLVETLIRLVSEAPPGG